MAGKMPQPTAPPADMTAGGPPTYNEAMGWSHPQPGPMIHEAVPGHRPLVNTSHQMQPVVQPVIVVQQQPTQVVLIGPKSVRLNCPACHASIKTSTETTNKMTAHICCLVLCLIGCWPCFFLPYCMSSCKQVTHKCPNCKSHLGIYNN